MSRYTGTSRTLGPIRQCAVYVRGALRCVWCCVFMACRNEATVDHLDGDHMNNADDNLLPACRPCNTRRRWGTFVDWLTLRGGSIVEALHRVAWQRWRPLPRSTGALLARRWHPERMAYEVARHRAKRARRAERQRFDITTRRGVERPQEAHA